MINIDTDGILDKCSSCGASAGFLRLGISNKHACQCSECANSTNWHISKLDAWQQWNHEQRKALGKK